MMVISRPSSSIHNEAMYGPYCLHLQCATSISLLTMKQTFVVRRASYERTYPFGQYVDLVCLLCPGSWMARTWCFACEAASKNGRTAPWFALPQLYCITVNSFITRTWCRISRSPSVVSLRLAGVSIARCHDLR